MEKGAAKVVKLEKETHDITSLYFEGFDESFGKRRAGSFLTLKIMQDGEWSKPHPFTISCAPEDPLLKVTMKRQGAFTTAAHGLKPGEEVICAGPYGLFCKDIDAQDSIVMIAGGVGITPFLSVLRHFRNIKFANRVVLIWSNRTIEDAFAQEELKQMTREIPLLVVNNLSRVPEGTDIAGYADGAFPGVFYEEGRCTRDLIGKYLPPDDPAIYLCGPPPMQDFVLGELEDLGVDPKSVKKENFTWKAT